MIKNHKRSGGIFAHILNKSLIRPISYDNSLWSLSKTRVSEAQTIVQLGCEFIQNMAKFQCCVCGFLFIFYHIPEDYSVDNYSIWCIRKIFYLHLSIPRAQANTVQHTYLIVVSITIFIIFHKLQSIKL